MRDLTDGQLRQHYWDAFMAAEGKPGVSQHLEGLRAVVRADRQHQAAWAKAATPKPETTETQR